MVWNIILLCQVGSVVSPVFDMCFLLDILWRVVYNLLLCNMSGLCFQSEIDTLWHMVRDLQEEIDTKQDSFREEMQQLNAKFSEAVCIPPMGRREYGVGAMGSAV